MMPIPSNQRRPFERITRNMPYDDNASEKRLCDQIGSPAASAHISQDLNKSPLSARRFRPMMQVSVIHWPNGSLGSNAVICSMAAKSLIAIKQKSHTVPLNASYLSLITGCATSCRFYGFTCSRVTRACVTGETKQAARCGTVTEIQHNPNKEPTP